MLLSPLLCGVGDQGWSPAGHVLAGMMTSNPLSRCVWMAFIEKGLSKSSAAFGVGGSVRGTGQMLYVKSPRESVPPLRERVRAKGRISHKQYSMQPWFPWQLACITKLSVVWDIKWQFRLWDLWQNKALFCFWLQIFCRTWFRTTCKIRLTFE